MSKRSKPEEATISFFSFQDIITSITGIMILVVLLLILEITRSKMSNFPVATSQYTENIVTAKKRVATAKKNLEEAQKWEMENKSIMELAATSRLKELPLILEKENKLEKSLTSKMQKLQSEIMTIQDISRQGRKSLESLAKHIEVFSQNKKDVESKLITVEKKLKTLEEDAENARKRIQFSYDRNESKVPVLVECSAEGLKAKLMDSTEIVEFKDSNPHYAEIIASFLRWLKEKKSYSIYVVLLIKPSASSYYMFIEESVSLWGFELGMEPIQEDKEAVF